MMKNKARELFNEAKRATENLRPGEPAFERKYTEMFNTFPSSADRLESVIHEKSALVACKKEVDDSVSETKSSKRFD